jgi:hypothetical protein
VATNLPLFELTLYKPYAEDATESTVLTPIGGAAHTDQFIVTTLQGISGAKPYLEQPSGRQGSLDPVTRKLSVGNLSVRVFDPRVTAGGSNAVRWMTAFVGDVAGRSRLKGCKFRLRRSLDGTTASLAPYFAGRIRDVKLDGLQRFTLDLVDGTASLSRQCFNAAPDPSVTYAAVSNLLPIGLPIAFGGVAPAPMLAGTLVSQYDVNVRAGVLNVAASLGDPLAALITKVYEDGAADPMAVRRAVVTLPGGSMVTLDIPARFVHPEVVSTGGSAIVHKRPQLLNVQTRVGQPLTDIPSGTSAVTFRVIQDAPPSATLPLLLADVHPVQLMADIIDGKYSVTSTDPTLHPLGTRDASGGGPWATMIADTSFGLCRFVIEKAWKASDFLEQQLCLPYGIGYRQDAQGRIVPFDLRQQVTVPVVAALTDADVIEDGSVQWSDGRDGAVTAVEYHSYTDAVRSRTDLANLTDLYPDISPTGIFTTESIILRLNDLSTLADVGEKIVKIDAQGSRQMVSAAPSGVVSTVAGDVNAAITDFLAPFQNGTIKFSVPYRVSSAAASVEVGQYVTADHAKHPNVSTNQRGGARRALCIGRMEQGGTVTLTLLDYGAAVSAAVPAFSSAAYDTTDNSIINVGVTGNAANDDVVVWACVTATGVGTRPADTDDGWYYLGRRSSTGTLAVAPFPLGKRVWLRARSQAVGVSANAPSTWVYPTPGYVDLPAVTVSLTVTANPADGHQCALAWTLSTPLGSDVYLRVTAGGVDALYASLLSGSTGYIFTDLLVSTGYTVTVKFRDAAGNIVATQAAGFTTAATVPVLQPPVGAVVFSSAPTSGSPDGSYGLAVVAVEVPGFVDVQEALETGVGAGAFGTATTIARVPAVVGNWTLVTRTAPNDGLKRRLSARSVRGAAVSAWTTGLDVLAWSAVPLPIYTGPPTPQLTQFAHRDNSADVVFVWMRDAATYAVWVYNSLVAIGTSDPYYAGTVVPTILAIGTDTYTAAVPAPGYSRRLHVLPVSSASVPGVLIDFDIFPSFFTGYKVTPTESGSTGTLSVAIDAALPLDNALRVSWAITVLGVRTLYAVNGSGTGIATTGPTTGATNATYSISFPLALDHNTKVEPLIHMADGSTLQPGGETFDSDRVADVVNVDVTPVGLVTVTFDTDTASGAATTNGPGQYSLDAGTTWTNVGVAARVASFTITPTAAAQPILVRGVNLAGVAGPSVAAVIPASSASTAPGFSAASITAAGAAYNGAGATSLSIDWTPTGAPSGATYRLTVYEQTTNNALLFATTGPLDGVTAVYSFACANTYASATASPGPVGTRTRTIKMKVEMIAGASIVATGQATVTLLSST